MGSEEIRFEVKLKQLKDQQMAYFNESEKNLTPKELKFLKQGVVFRHIKVFALKLRHDEILEREYYIKKNGIGNEYSNLRPRSGDSMTTIRSLSKKEKKLEAIDKDSASSPR